MKKSDFKILVAEDDEMLGDVIATSLSEDGYSVAVANDGLAAIRLLRIDDIKLVLTDLRMPGADGMEVLKTAMSINPKIAVVILTAYGTLDNALNAMQKGAYDYLLKPFVMQQLLMVVRNAYQRDVLIRENEEFSSCLRDTYRNLETIKTLGNSSNPDITIASLERIKKLLDLNIINAEEADILKEKLIPREKAENTNS